MQPEVSRHSQPWTMHVQVNPLTAYAMLDALAAPKGEYIIQTAAGSVLGREFIALAKKRGVKTINVVRRSAQKAELQELGWGGTSPSSL